MGGQADFVITDVAGPGSGAAHTALLFAIQLRDYRKTESSIAWIGPRGKCGFTGPATVGLAGEALRQTSSVINR